jgi:deoxycytidylate deaminase
MDAAYKEAENSSLSEWSIGAVIVKGNRIVGRGYNKFSADVEKFKLQFGFSDDELWSLHAEMAAIVDAEEDLEGAVMFVNGFKSKNGNPILCKPCECCMKMLKHVPVHTVYYASRQGVKILHTD